MGIPENRAKRGLHNTNNQGVAEAMEWVFSHGDDPDIDQPLNTSTNTTTDTSSGINESLIPNIQELGFSTDQAKLALKNTDSNVERAVEWLFSHQDELDDLIKQDKEQNNANQNSNSTKENNLSDGEGKYELIGFISHMGTNTSCGHYVCHLKKEVNGKNEWILFNDRKVAISENPPFDMGYMYLYKRK
jgi:ubiquitin carboxyl-terminal hydrolase 5/13